MFWVMSPDRMMDGLLPCMRISTKHGAGFRLGSALHCHWASKYGEADSRFRTVLTNAVCTGAECPDASQKKKLLKKHHSGFSKARPKWRPQDPSRTTNVCFMVKVIDVVILGRAVESPWNQLRLAWNKLSFDAMSSPHTKEPQLCQRRCHHVVRPAVGRWRY